MADTIRAKAAIIALINSNVNGEISDQDLRDAIVTLFNMGGFMYVTGGAASQSFTTTPSKLTCWTTAGTAEGFTASTSDDRFTASQDCVATVTANLSLTVTGAPPYELTFYVYVNGALVAGTKSRVSVLNTGTTYNITVSGRAAITSGQTIEIWGESDAGGGASVVVSEAQFSVKTIA